MRYYTNHENQQQFKLEDNRDKPTYKYKMSKFLIENVIPIINFSDLSSFYIAY